MPWARKLLMLCGSRLMRSPVLGVFDRLARRSASSAGCRQGHSVRDLGQRVRLELAQAEAEQTFGFQQQFDFVQIQGDLVGLVFPGQLIQRRLLGNRQHPGHRRTALEGMQGAATHRWPAAAHCSAA